MYIKSVAKLNGRVLLYSNRMKLFDISFEVFAFSNKVYKVGMCVRFISNCH